MFIYLSKKIAIPSCTKISCLEWNKQDGYIAIGGANGLLKVLLLESGGAGDADAGGKSKITQSSNLSMNETLEGHVEDVRVVTWNEHHKRLTSSDANGVIIVWMMYKGSWYEEMINNRKKSTVTGMAWSSDGNKICIVYEDGGVIVGSVDGNRIWGKDLKGLNLTGVQWSPDNKFLLLASKNGDLFLYDNLGNFFMNVQGRDTGSSDLSSISSLDWFNGSQAYGSSSRLAICWESGRAQLMFNAGDEDPVVIDTKMLTVHCRWNHSGSLLAISGRMIDGDKAANVVRFYNSFGEHLRTLKVPGLSISCSSWEGGSLRIALAVDSHIYFANIRPDYKWCYFSKTIVFTSYHKNKTGTRVTFWNTNNNQCHTKVIPILIDISNCKDHCIIAARCSDNPNETILMVCDTFGTVIDSLQVSLDLCYVSMIDSYVIGASKFYFFIWYFNTPKLTTGKQFRFKAFFIDDVNPLRATLERDRVEIEAKKGVFTDRIACITAMKAHIIIGRESGIINHYAMPNCDLLSSYQLPSRPHKLALNCNATRLSMIDVAGVFHVFNIAGGLISVKQEDKLERKDVWSMCWASDNPQSFAIMEKTRMYIFKGMFPEEPISCSGYICSFNNLEILTVLLDDLLDNIDKPDSKFLIRMETKSLRDTRQLVENVNLNEARKFIEDNPHPRLWQLLAESALKKNELTIAETAFVKSQNYKGILFLNKLKAVTKPKLHKAFVNLFLNNFEEAERVFLDNDRVDLALETCQMVGNWFRVIQLLKTSDQKLDDLLFEAYKNIGDYFAQNQNWQSALEYYQLGKQTDKIIECYCHLDQYSELVNMAQLLSDNDPLLKVIARKLAAEGIFPEIVEIYEKMGDIESAKRLCILHNRWNLAFTLAIKYDLPDIALLFQKYNADLLNKNQLKKAIEVNVQAEYYLEAAGYTYKLAETEAQRSRKYNCLRLKKLYVCAAQLFRQYITKTSAVKEFMNMNLVENAWKGAHAYHFLGRIHVMIANEDYYNAMCIAYKLQEYIGILPAKDVYYLLAAMSYRVNNLNLCSAAFVKLQSLDLTPEERSQISRAAVDIFKNKRFLDKVERKYTCIECNNLLGAWRTDCDVCGVKFETCIVSGFSIISSDGFWQCTNCYSSAFMGEIYGLLVCPMCHAPTGWY